MATKCMPPICQQGGQAKCTTSQARAQQWCILHALVDPHGVPNHQLKLPKSHHECEGAAGGLQHPLFGGPYGPLGKVHTWGHGKACMEVHKVCLGKSW